MCDCYRGASQLIDNLDHGLQPGFKNTGKHGGVNADRHDADNQQHQGHGFYQGCIG